MAKIMLVEDDNNLREIYEARLLAEGYEIVSAEDGEQALALAVKEKPDLIISDVMMPKISGFDMLDILRSTPETKHTKVIMMTALSQTEDKDRADKLGADRYLVKSQVTLEDVAKVAQEVLQDGDTLPAAVTQAPEPAAAPAASSPAQQTPVQPTPAPAPVTDMPVATPPADPAAPAAAQPAVQAPTPAPTPAPDPDPSTSSAPTPTANADATNAAANVAADMANAVNNLLQNNPSQTADPATPAQAPDPTPAASNHIAGKKVIRPINDLSANSGPDLNALLAKEMGQDPGATPVEPQPPTTTQPTPETPADEQPVDLPLPGNVQTPGNPNDPNNIAL